MPNLTLQERTELSPIVEDLDATASRQVFRQFLFILSKNPSIKAKTFLEVLKDANLYNEVLKRKGI